MVEVLLQLSKAGYHISNYTYVGFGSVYYIDFVMFHKYLFIEHMICVEWGDVPKRMKFNKPFKCITLKLGAILHHIPSLSPTKKYLIWLDYDRPLDDEMLLDIDGCLRRIAKDSIFIVTIDARPKLQDPYDLEDLPAADRVKQIVEVYSSWFGKYVDYKIDADIVSDSDVSTLFYDVTLEKMRQTLSGRGLQFIQLFNYLYADGAPMLTIGGIVGNAHDAESFRLNEVSSHKYLETGRSPIKISVPPLTIREKQWLDSRLDDGLLASKLEFELEQELLDNYRRFYKEYPMFTEALL